MTVSHSQRAQILAKDIMAQTTCATFIKHERVLHGESGTAYSELQKLMADNHIEKTQDTIREIFEKVTPLRRHYTAPTMYLLTLQVDAVLKEAGYEPLGKQTYDLLQDYQASAARSQSR